MPDIHQDKHVIASANEPRSYFNIDAVDTPKGPSVRFTVCHDGVRTMVCCSPNEAVAIGTNILLMVGAIVEKAKRPTEAPLVTNGVQ